MNRNLFSGTIIMGLALMIFSCSGPAVTYQPTAVPVNLMKVNLQEASYYNFYPGNVVALNEVDLNSEVSGFITDISFQE